MPRSQRFTNRTHPIWTTLRCILLFNLLAGFVACAYNIQIGMGIIAASVALMGVALLLRIIGVCPDRTTYWFNSDSPTLPTRAPSPPRPTIVQKQEYVLVSNPDTTVSIGTRVFAPQPPASEYPPPY